MSEEYYKYISEDCSELYDDVIIKDLKETVEMYENGELVEVADMLNNISFAINQWDGSY